jgi:3-phenylpropionate/cinnamic acid dioxygenase small subunit
MRDPAARMLLQYEVEQLYYREARLLDQRRLAEWLELFADDASYAMPIGDPDPHLEAHVGDRRELGMPLGDYDRAFLGLVVERFVTQQAYAERPPSITRHLISNVEVQETELPDEVDVGSCFVVFQTRVGRFEQTFYGARQDRLRQVGDQWRIVRRTVTLDHSPLPRVISILF